MRNRYPKDLLLRCLSLIFTIVWVGNAQSNAATDKLGNKYICLSEGRYHFFPKKSKDTDQSKYDIESETGSMQYIFEQNDDLIVQLSDLIGSHVRAPRFSYHVSHFPSSVDLPNLYERRSERLQRILNQEGTYRYFETVVLSKNIMSLQSRGSASKWHLFDRNRKQDISAVHRWRGSCLYMHKESSSRCTYSTMYQDNYVLTVKFPGQAVLYGKTISNHVSSKLDTEILMSSADNCGSRI